MASILPQTAEYAIRAMARFAAHPVGEVVLARDLSASTGIPSSYLSKILRRLVLAGILESQKGRGGGFRLARPAEQVTVRDILAAVDAYPDDGRCAFGWGACSAAHPCPLHDAWGRMDTEFRGWACSTTLADLSPRSGRARGRARRRTQRGRSRS